MNIPGKYWSLLNELVVTSDIVIDRPKGTSHPHYPDLIYPLDYGYLANTCSSDGDAVDAWVGSLNSKHITGVVCTVDTEDRDVEVKLLLGCTMEETNIIVDIHNQGTQAAFVIRQPN
jgi:inorganic pyrophosphatase